MKHVLVLLLIIVFSLIIQTQNVHSQEIDYYKSEGTISTEKIIFFDIILLPKKIGEEPREFSLDLFFKIKNFNSELTFSNSSCDTVDISFGSRIRCNINDNRSGRISLFYETNELIKPIEGKLIYKEDFKVPLKTKKLSITTKLEEGLILLDENNTIGLSPYLPSFGQRGSDGRRIFVFWEKEDVEKDDGISVRIIFESIKQITKTNSDPTFFYLLFGVIIALIAGLFFYRTRSSGIKSAITILKDDERKVINILEELEGKAKQKQIQEKGDFSKATLSRLIKNLEERGLIKTERLGRSNRIYLNKEISKKEKAEEKSENNEVAPAQTLLV